MPVLERPGSYFASRKLQSSNIQTKSKQGKTKQTNKSKNKKRGVLFFLNAVVIKVIGELYFGKKT